MAVQLSLTNEEKRVVVYRGGDRPTAPRSVTPETPLCDLNLNWRERDLPERERTKHVHRLHPYLGKFIPQLVEVFLRKYFKPGQTVLDPFVGSGTTSVQANELGINSVGYDVSAFNVLLCRAKTARYDLPVMRAELVDILAKTKAATSPQREGGMWPQEIEAGTGGIGDDGREYLSAWFAPQARRELLTYCHFIQSGGYRYADLLKIVLSRAARSARLTTHFDLDFPKRPQTEPYRCYKHSRTCKPTTEALKFLERYTLDTIRRIGEYAVVRTDANVSVRHEDSRNAALPPVDGVITSPPYVGLIDYHDQHAYAYELLGLEDKRGWEIGPAANGSSERAKCEYQQAIAAVFSSAVSAMPPGGRLIVVANDKFDLYGPIADLVGVEVEAVVQRQVNRRTGRRSGEFYESVFIWRKQS
ncbi:MAG TPA: DNA methyltransferase [Armatimonadota bacterium]|nr:DNA methyltransferase [Armatimonadota bacterium]